MVQHLAILGLVRGSSESLAGLLESLAPFCRKFQTARMIIGCPYGSREAQIVFRHGLSALYDPEFPPGISRFARLAILRNRLIDAFHESGWYADTVLMIDMDIERVDFIPGLKELRERKDWSVVASLGLKHPRRFEHSPEYPMFGELAYWDLLALESITGERVLWRVGDQFYGHGNAPDGTGFSHVAPVIDPKRWTPVNSAFGPAAFYRASVLKDVRYDESGLECEHQTFHRLLRERGAKLFISPDLKAYYD